MSDTLLNDNKGQKLTLDLVASNNKFYNFIIETSSGVFDTSEYNICYKWSNAQTTLADVFTGSKVDAIVLVSNSKYIGSGDNKLAISDQITKGSEKGIVIFDYTVERIYVKSKRNFLENQLPVKP